MEKLACYIIRAFLSRLCVEQTGGAFLRKECYLYVDPQYPEFYSGRFLKKEMGSISAGELPPQYDEVGFGLTRKANFSYTFPPKGEVLLCKESSYFSELWAFACGGAT